MKVATIIARILLGLVFVVFGSNAFLHFIPMPPPPAGLAGDFMKSLFMSQYFYVVAVTQILGGLLVLSGRFTTLGLLFLGPVIVNILSFHIFLNREGLPLAIVVAVLALFLLWQKRSNFAGLLKG
ncbi:MAG: DoxX family membrane protein [Verrucomicrobiae bacterium]